MFSLISTSYVLLSLVSSAHSATHYEKIVEEMRTLENTSQRSVRMFSIGQNDDGEEIYALRISSDPSRTSFAKAGNIIVGTHHGNEVHAATFVMRYAQSLAQRYESTALFRTDLADTEWTLIPVLNISGYNARHRHEHGHDPNRDYPGPCNDAPGGKLKSIRTLQEYIASRPFSGSLTVHGYIGTLTFPWGVALEPNADTLDQEAFYHATSLAAEKNGYRFGTSTDIVYPATGTYEDYVYWKHGLWSLLLELRTGSSDDIEKTVSAIDVYFDSIDRSASTQNTVNGTCARMPVDLHLE